MIGVIAGGTSHYFYLSCIFGVTGKDHGAGAFAQGDSIPGPVEGFARTGADSLEGLKSRQYEMGDDVSPCDDGIFVLAGPYQPEACQHGHNSRDAGVGGYQRGGAEFKIFGYQPGGCVQGDTVFQTWYTGSGLQHTNITLGAGNDQHRLFICWVQTTVLQGGVDRVDQ